MKSYNDEAIIIRIKSTGEADRIITALGKKKGTIEAIAKSAAKSESKKVSSIDLLNHVKANLYQGKTMDLLKEVEVINDYGEIKRNQEIINDLLYILEILQKLEVSYLADNNTFKLLKDLLDLLVEYPKSKNILISSFELKILNMSGFRPQLDQYLGTEENILPGERRKLSINGGVGYVKAEKNDKLVEDSIIKMQKYTLQNSLRNVLQVNLSPEQIKQIKAIHRVWIETVIEKRLKSISLLKD